MNELIQKKLTKNDLKENIIKETDAQLPSSRREIEEDMLEQICLIANAGAEITVEELCSRMDMSRREVNFYLKQLKVHGYIIREKVTSTGHQKDGSGSGISLTEFGKITGEEFQYRHEILTQFLQFVGVSDEKAQEDACRMEHIVSEETVRQVCNFVNYGETFERVLRYTDLSYRYAPGDYVFLMGIYYMEKTYPRRFAREFHDFSQNIRLHVEEEKSWFELEINPEPDSDLGCLWYKDQQKWIRAELHKGKPVIPSDVFEFSIQRQDPVIEGNALIAFANEDEEPVDWNSRELDVHIW